MTKDFNAMRQNADNKYSKLLEDGFRETSNWNYDPNFPQTRLEYLGEHIFGFTTYESEVLEKMTKKALEVCEAITCKKTFDYISTSESNEWYLIMVNMPFFCNRLDWGTSIRGAWWCYEMMEFRSCGLYDGDNQMTDTLKLDTENWRLFIAALLNFAEVDNEQNHT
jgi:hypothetical protein